MILSKDMFVGMLLNTNPQVAISKRPDGIPQVETFWLLSCKNREDMFRNFADEYSLKFGTSCRNGNKFIRIQDRTTLQILLKMIPQWIIDKDQRLGYFSKIMKIIRENRHLTQDGLDEIKLLKMEMMTKVKNK